MRRARPWMRGRLQVVTVAPPRVRRVSGSMSPAVELVERGREMAGVDRSWPHGGAPNAVRGSGLDLAAGHGVLDGEDVQQDALGRVLPLLQRSVEGPRPLVARVVGHGSKDAPCLGHLLTAKSARSADRAVSPETQPSI